LKLPTVRFKSGGLLWDIAATDMKNKLQSKKS
jgi:hypothetical protein